MPCSPLLGGISKYDVYNSYSTTIRRTLSSPRLRSLVATSVATDVRLGHCPGQRLDRSEESEVLWSWGVGVGFTKLAWHLCSPKQYSCNVAEFDHKLCCASIVKNRSRSILCLTALVGLDPFTVGKINTAERIARRSCRQFVQVAEVASFARDLDVGWPLQYTR